MIQQSAVVSFQIEPLLVIKCGIKNTKAFAIFLSLLCAAVQKKLRLLSSKKAAERRFVQL